MSDVYAVPTVGVTGVLVILWLLAALLGGPLSPAATALDPAMPGSVGAQWGLAQLLLVLLLGLSGVAPRRLAIAAAALLAGETGAYHLTLAPPAAAALGVPALPVKSLLAALLGLFALSIAANVPRAWRPAWSLRACAAAGVGAGALDLCQAAGPLPAAAWLVTGEEWCEVVLAAILAGWTLRAGIKKVSIWDDNLRYRPWYQARDGHGRQSQGDS